MKNSNTAKHSDLSGSLFGEFALAPYRAAIKWTSMAQIGAIAAVRMNRALIDACRESVRGQQDAFSKLSASILSRLSHNGGTPAEAMGVMSQSLADMYRSATEGAAEFEQAVANAREQCFAGLRGDLEHSTIVSVEGAEKKAA